MRCQKCRKDFPENEIHVSHDVPKYIGGTDKDGRHNICKKHHDIYEKMVFAFMVKNLPKPIKMYMRKKAKKFSEWWFKKEGENGHPS